MDANPRSDGALCRSCCVTCMTGRDATGRRASLDQRRFEARSFQEVGILSLCKQWLMESHWRRLPHGLNLAARFRHPRRQALCADRRTGADHVRRGVARRGRGPAPNSLERDRRPAVFWNRGNPGDRVPGAEQLEIRRDRRARVTPLCVGKRPKASVAARSCAGENLSASPRAQILHV